MRLLVIPFLLVSMLFTACQKAVDADGLLDTEEKIYLSSYLSPQDTVLRVFASRAFASVGTPLSVDDFEANEAKFLIKDAVVTISDAMGNSASLVYVEEEKSYLAPAEALTIRANEDYFLEVNVDGEAFNASCTIPRTITTVNETILVRESDFGGQQSELNLSFEDIAGERNFYITGAIVGYTFQFDEQEPQQVQFPLFFEEDEFLTDNLQDGGFISASSQEYFLDTGIEDGTLTIQVANVEEILWQNLRAIAQNEEEEGNPFIEFSIAPDNFEDEKAVGVFAGYNLTEKIVTFDIPAN